MPDSTLHVVDSRAIVLFGATGDLAQRMLWPSIYALDADGLLTDDFRLIGVARSTIDTAQFIEQIKAALLRSANAQLFSEAVFARFIQRIRYISMDLTNPAGFADLKSALGTHLERGIVFYLSTAPHLFAPLCLGLREAGLVNPRSRVVIEKPMGSNLASAREINDTIATAFDETQIFRIDHYLGKEPVQNLIALRFANAIFEPLWNSTAIEQVQITVSETVGVEGRWSYYDQAGALQDMVQSHLLQLLCLVAMEPPASFTPSAVRNEKVKVLWSLRPISGADVLSKTVSGQYAAGFSGNATAPGYRQEPGANPDSDTETFVALRAEIDNWRWAGVPFYLRTGKRMPQRVSEIVIQFKAAPYNIFAGVGATLNPNMLLIRLQPNESITFKLMHKEPALSNMQLGQVSLNLSVGEAFEKARRRIGYERLILDALSGNSALFVRRDEIEAAWTWVDGIVDGWRRAGIKPKPYAAGSWGPSAAIGLPERFGHSWHE